jgi:hypothetical protein
VLKTDRDLARRLGNLLPVTGLPHPSELPTRAPPRTKNYSLVGTAFDYLFRFEVQRRNPLANVKPWIAAAAVKLLRPTSSEEGAAVDEWSGIEDLGAVADQATRILMYAKSAHQRYLGILDPSETQVADVASHALRLAKLDVIFRAGIVDPALDSVDPLDVQDLVGLSKIIPFDESLAGCLAGNVWLNPTFGRFSAGIQGADADVIAETVLIDIKTTIKPDTRPHLAQLVGYAMLAEAYRSEEAPEFPRVESVGIYFARQGALVTAPMEPARKNPDFPEAVAALMVHCSETPLTMNDLRSTKKLGVPKTTVPEKRSVASGRRAR